HVGVRAGGEGELKRKGGFKKHRQKRGNNRDGAGGRPCARRRPPHSLHRSTSMAKTRARSAAQSRRQARMVAGTRAGVGKEVDDSSSVLGGAGGTISARPAALGAKTPWYLGRCRRGAGSASPGDRGTRGR